MTKLKIGDEQFINYEFKENIGKPVLVFSNSLGSDLTMWDPQVEYFRNDFQIVRYDKRGHGNSSPFEGPYSFDMLENDVIKILDELKINKANFIGLSMGGMTSIGLALRHPGRFDKMVCCAARADMPPPLKEMWDQRIEVVKHKGTNGVVDGSIERWYSEDFNKNSKNKTCKKSLILILTP